VTIFDGNGDYVNGLQPHQFRLFDNAKEQDIKVDVTYQPISMVIAIQKNGDVEAVLPQIRTIGPLIRPLVIGDQGEAAVLAFDHRLDVLQDFTNDPDKIGEAVKKLKPGSSSSRMIDAVTTRVPLLSPGPRDRRGVPLRISETRDKASEGRVRDAVLAAEVNNVIVYAVDVSRLVTTLTKKPLPARPDPLPPAARPLPPNVPATPNTVAQTFGSQGARAEFVPLLVEIFKDAKGIFVDNPVEVFTKATGGSEFGFMRQRGLEQAINKVGVELHSQYMITYNPNNKADGGFHEIRVQVAGFRSDSIRTRPGYWLASKQ